MVELSGKWQPVRDKNANGFRAVGAPEGHRHQVQEQSGNISGLTAPSPINSHPGLHPTDHKASRKNKA